MSRSFLAGILRFLGWGWLPSALFQYRRKNQDLVWTEPPGQVLLDIGGGTGLTVLEKAVQYRDAVFVVLDYDPTELRKGKQLAAALHLSNVHWVRGDARQLPLKQRCVDTLIAANILLEFKGRISNILNEWKQCLKSGAVLFVETPIAPQRKYMFQIAGIVALVRKSVDPSHGFVQGELQADLLNAGLHPRRQRMLYRGIGVLARELYYIAMCLHPLISSILWLPLGALMHLEPSDNGQGNAMMIVAGAD